MSRDDARRKARSDYIYRRMMQSTIAAAYGVSEATVGRWKKAAKEDGDDWNKARTAPVIAGEGVEGVVSSVVEDFRIQAQAILDEIKDGKHTTIEKVGMLVSLSDAMTKMATDFARNIELNVDAFPADPVAKMTRLAGVAEADGFEFFIETCLPHCVKGEASLFHRAIFERVPEILASDKGVRDLFIAPRGSSKSTHLSLGPRTLLHRHAQNPLLP